MYPQRCHKGSIIFMHVNFDHFEIQFPQCMSSRTFKTNYWTPTDQNKCLLWLLYHCHRENVEKYFGWLVRKCTLIDSQWWFEGSNYFINYYWYWAIIALRLVETKKIGWMECSPDGPISTTANQTILIMTNVSQSCPPFFNKLLDL